MSSVDRRIYTPIDCVHVPSSKEIRGFSDVPSAQEVLKQQLPQPPSNESLQSNWSWSDLFSGAVSLATSPAYAVAGLYQRWSGGSLDDNIDGEDSCCKRFSACSNEESVVMESTLSAPISIETLKEFVEIMIQGEQSQAEFSLLDISRTAGKLTCLEYGHGEKAETVFVVTQFWRDYQRGSVFVLCDGKKSSHRFPVSLSTILEGEMDSEDKKDLRCLRSYEALRLLTSSSRLKSDVRWLPILQAAVSQNTENALFGKIMIASLDVGSKAMAEELPAFRFKISCQKECVHSQVDISRYPIEITIHRNIEGGIQSVDVSYAGFLDVVDMSTQCILAEKAVRGEIRYTMTLDEEEEVQIGNQSAQFFNAL